MKITDEDLENLMEAMVEYKEEHDDSLDEFFCLVPDDMACHNGIFNHRGSDNRIITI